MRWLTAIGSASLWCQPPRRTRSAGAPSTAPTAAPPIAARWVAPPFAVPAVLPLSGVPYGGAAARGPYGGTAYRAPERGPWRQLLSRGDYSVHPVSGAGVAAGWRWAPLPVRPPHPRPMPLRATAIILRLITARMLSDPIVSRMPDPTPLRGSGAWCRKQTGGSS